MKLSKCIRYLALVLGLVVGLAGAAEAAAQTTKPPPRPKPEAEEVQKPTARPKNRPTGPQAPPPPKLVISSDMPCTVELNGEPLGRLEKDTVEEFRIRPGDHLLQALPEEVEGPVWKQTLKAPETGSVVATVELRPVVDEWNEARENVDRFQVASATVTDQDTGLEWMRNASPAMRWEDVEGYCRAKKDAGGGWRLPTLNELSKLLYEDHPAPPQETDRGETRWTILGKRKGEMTVQPRLIHEPFDHNSVAAIWVRDQQPRTACSFLGGFTCSIERKKTEAVTLCVRPVRR